MYSFWTFLKVHVIIWEIWKFRFQSRSNSNLFKLCIYSYICVFAGNSKLYYFLRNLNIVEKTWVWRWRMSWHKYIFRFWIEILIWVFFVLSIILIILKGIDLDSFRCNGSPTPRLSIFQLQISKILLFSTLNRRIKWC